MNLSAFDYKLPEELIAQRPLDRREDSRMLVLYRAEQRWEDRRFVELPGFLRAGDCLVLNDSRVIPSRLFGHRAGLRSLPIGKHNPKRREYLSGRVEVLLLRPLDRDHRTWTALVRPGRKMRVGEVVEFENDLKAEVLERGERGERTLRFFDDGDVEQELERIGHVPLPLYIRRPDEPDQEIHVSRSNGMKLLRDSAGLDRSVDRMPLAEVNLLLGRMLGRALAHELGHFLLRSRTHTTAGLMRSGRAVREFLAPGRRGFEVDAAQRSAVVARIRQMTGADI